MADDFEARIEGLGALTPEQQLEVLIELVQELEEQLGQ